MKRFLLFLFVLSLPTGYGNAATISAAVLSSMWDFSYSRIEAALQSLGSATTKFPRNAPQKSVTWQTEGPNSWISGFFPGCLWYIYEKKKDDVFLQAAKRWTMSLSGQSNTTSTHDVGFMIFCSYGNGYRLLQDASYKAIIHKAAASLATRYRPRAGTIDSWSFSPFTDANGWETIIDNMMNLELLFWSARNGGDPRYDTIARTHALTTMKNHFRDDGSTYHVVRYSTATGAVTSRETRQGYANSSCWARGQAWAVYGFTMAYRFTNDSRFLATACNAADYFLRRLPADCIPYWDFDAPGIPADTVPRDASASAIVAAALLELCRYTGIPDSARYADAAIMLINGLWSERYRGLPTQASIINHCTGSRKEGHDVDMGIIYADYYFIEALLRYDQYICGTPTSVKMVVQQGVVMNPDNKSGNMVITLLGRKNPWDMRPCIPAVTIDPSRCKKRLIYLR